MVVVIAGLLLPAALFAQEEKQPLITDDFNGVKTPADKYFEKWLDEYVVWIITDSEKDKFEELPTIEEKLKFIELFWLKRDPYPETLINEFKEQYYDRIRYANANFSYGDTPGILSHRGMVYAVLGPPQYEDRNFSFTRYQTRYLRPGEVNARRGLVWMYADQPGVRIPSYYQIVFMKFGNNRYEIVLDAYANVRYMDSLIDSGSMGMRGFIPNRLLTIMRDKKQYYIKNDEKSLSQMQSNDSFSNLENKKVKCEFTEGEDIWGEINCRIPYPEIIFRADNGKSILSLTGVAIVESRISGEAGKYSFEDVNMALTDEELVKRYEESLDLNLIITKKPENFEEGSIFVELKDEASGVIYSSTIEIKK